MPGGPPRMPIPAPIPAPESARSDVVVPHAASSAAAHRAIAIFFISDLLRVVPYRKRYAETKVPRAQVTFALALSAWRASLEAGVHDREFIPTSNSPPGPCIENAM